MALQRTFLLVDVALEELVGDLERVGGQRLRVHAGREVRNEDAVDHVADGVAQVRVGIAGAHADQGADVEVELLGLALEQDRIVGEGDRDQHVRLHVLQPLDDRCHVGEELVVAFVVDQIDVLFLGVGADGVADRLSERAVLPQQCDAQVGGRFAEPLGELAEREVDGRLAVTVGRRPTWNVYLKPRLVMMSAAPAVSQWNTPWRSAAWLTGTASSDTPEPSVILTPSLVVRRSVSLMAAVGVGMSASRKSTLRPLTPPRSLIMSRAICIAV